MTMVDNTPILLIAAAIITVISLAIGAVIGFILAGMRNSPEDSSKNRKDLTDVAKFVRHSRTGQMGVEIDGKIHVTPKEINAVQRKALVQVYEDLQRWLGLEGRPVNTAAATAPQTASPQVAPPQQAKPPAGPVKPAAIVTPARPSTISAPPPAVKPPSMDLRDILSSAMSPGLPAKEEAAQPTTLAGQVDAIIQERLPQSVLWNRNIHVKDSPDGGILVLVVGQRYQGVGDVTDTQVRDFIQACVNEWEQRYGK